MQSKAVMVNPCDDGRLGLARALVESIESGEEAETTKALDELTRLRETALFREMGKLTRELHETLNGFRWDARLANLASVDIPDAKQRLNYVIDMTEQAAMRTLGAIEESKPVAERLARRTKTIKADWGRFMDKKMPTEEFNSLCEHLTDHLASTEQGAITLSANLSNMLVAQEFQDLTGQIIRRVIKLVEDVEHNLVNLIRISGAQIDPAAKGSKHTTDPLQGPQSAGLESSDAVSGQDEVDTLLSSLGF